jgi:hypothetical protein
MQIISDHFQKTPAIQIPKGIFQSGRLRQPSIGHDQSQGLRTRMPIVLSSKLLWYIYIISSWAILKIAEIRPLGRWGPHNPSSCSMFDIVWHIYNFTHTHTTHTYTVCIYIYIYYGANKSQIWNKPILAHEVPSIGHPHPHWTMAPPKCSPRPTPRSQCPRCNPGHEQNQPTFLKSIWKIDGDIFWWSIKIVIPNISWKMCHSEGWNVALGFGQMYFTTHLYSK